MYIKKGLLHIIRNSVLNKELFLTYSDDEASENENSSTLTEENKNDTPKDSFSILAEKLDTLQNFLLSEISDIKAEMKNKCNQMTSKEISSGNDKKVVLLQNQLICLREECNFKNQLKLEILEIS